MKYKLRVDDARKSDVGKQIARIPVNIADKMGLRTGDIVEIKGKRTTYAKAWRSSPPELTEDRIKLDPLIRKNLKVSLDDMVEISTGTATMAKSITVHPIQAMTVTQNLIPHLSKGLIDKIMIIGDSIELRTGISGSLYFNIGKTEPEGPVIFNRSTEIKFFKGDVSEESTTKEILEVSYESIGGLTNAIQKIREMIELPLRYPEIFDHLGIQPPKGVLLYGPPGTGKTLLGKAVASETSSSFYLISGPEITSRYYGESESKLRDIFEEAKNKAPSIIFIDEIDSIVPKRDEGGGEVERRIVAQLLSLMDGVNTRGDVVVIGSTNRPNSIDEALRRGGRFDREIEVGIPSTAGRLEILQIHTRGMPLADDVDLEELANITHGFVGADLQVLTKEAALYSLRRFLPDLVLNNDLSKTNLETLEGLNIMMPDFQQAMTEVSPSALREVYIEVPNIHWDDIGGLDEVKKELRKAIEWPIKYQKAYDKIKADPPNGILLYGPPGTGKTMLAKAIANESQANFISIKGPELISKWVGEGEKGVREIFRKARAAAPCIIFFDEIDSIATRRSDDKSNDAIKRVVSQLLTEIDGVEEIKGVIILGATNRPDVIDPALTRPGRFDKEILVGNPDTKSRQKIFKVHLRGIKLGKSVSIPKLSELTEGYSGAEISAIVSEAKINLIEKFVEKHKSEFESHVDEMELTMQGLLDVLKYLKPSSTKRYDLRPPRISELDSDFA